MKPRKALRLVLAALGPLLLLSIGAPAHAAAGSAETGPPTARTAQAEPAKTVDAGLLAGATWVLLLPLVLLAKLKISEARRIAWWSAHPGLEARQIADYLEDYRLDPDAEFPR